MTESWMDAAQAQRGDAAARPVHQLLARVRVAEAPAWIGKRGGRAAAREVAARAVVAAPVIAPPVEEQAEADRAAEEARRREAEARAAMEAIATERARLEAIAVRQTAAIAALDAAAREAVRPYSAETVELGLMIAREVLGRELTVDGAALRLRVEAALAAIGPDRPVIVRLAPADAERAHEAAAELAGVELVEDAELEPGACFVESPKRVIDASIETRLAAIRATLMEVLAAAAATAEERAHAR